MKRLFLFWMLLVASVAARAWDGWSRNDVFYVDGVKYKVVQSAPSSNPDGINRVMVDGFQSESVTSFRYENPVMYQGFTWSVMMRPNSIFKNNTHLKTIDLIDLYTSNSDVIQDSYFEGCTALERVYIGEAKHIGKRAFYGCYNLELVGDYLGNSTSTGLSTIGEEAFRGCRKLQQMPFYETTSIGDYAFIGTGLKELTFGSESPVPCHVGKEAFRGLDLDEIYIYNDNALVIEEGNMPFYLCSVGVVALRNNVTVAPPYMFENYAPDFKLWCDGPNTSLGAGFMKGCSMPSLTVSKHCPVALYPETFSEPLEHLYTLCDNYDLVNSELHVLETYASWADFLPEENELEIRENMYESFRTEMEAVMDPAMGSLRFNTINGENEQADFFGCSGKYTVAVMVADDNYRFLQWDDGNTDNPRYFDLTEQVSWVIPEPQFINRNDIIEMEVEYVLVDADGNEISIIKAPEKGKKSDDEQEVDLDELVKFYQQNQRLVESERSGMTFSATYRRSAHSEAFIYAQAISDDFLFDHFEIADFEYMTPEELEVLQPIYSMRANFQNSNIAIISLVYSDVTIGEELYEDAQAFAHSLRVYFKQRKYHHVVIASSDPDMGHLGSGSDMDTYVEDNATVMTYAVPNDGYKFVNWSDGVTDIARYITITQDTVIIANFARSRFNITVLSADESMGMVTGGGTYDENTTAEITATPYEGFKFVKWSDGNTDNPRSLTVTEDKTIIANFREKGVGVEQTRINTPQAAKELRNGVLTITLTDGQTYNAQGQIIK